MIKKAIYPLYASYKSTLLMISHGACIFKTGTPLSIPNWKLHHIIETLGASIVGEEMCTGLRYCENLVDEEATDMDTMVENLIKDEK